MNAPPANLGAIRLLALDVDGVLTDGTIGLGEDGIETRRYHARDGIGLVLARHVGVQVALVSASPSPGIGVRAERLGIVEVLTGVRDKAAAVPELAARLDVPLAAVCFMGDDLVDLGVMQLVGMSACPADANYAVRTAATIVTAAPGGHGAVRELCEMLADAHDPAWLAQVQQCGLRL